MGKHQTIIESPPQNVRQLVNQVYGARANQLKQMRRLIQSQLKKEGYENVFIRRMVLAINEACANIIQHAYANANTERFRVEILTNDVELIIRLTDSAPTVDKDSIKPRALDDIRPGGLGVHFIYEIMDDVKFLETAEGGGNIMQMTKRIEHGI